MEIVMDNQGEKIQKGAIAEKEYFFQVDENDKLILIISSKDGEPDLHPIIVYDGSEYALFYRNEGITVLLDYLHPAIHEPLGEAKEIIVREVDLDKQEVAFEYNVMVRHTKMIPLPEEYRNRPSFSELAGGNEDKLIFTPEELQKMAAEVKPDEN